MKTKLFLHILTLSLAFPSFAASGKQEAPPVYRVQAPASQDATTTNVVTVTNYVAVQVVTVPVATTPSVRFWSESDPYGDGRPVVQPAPQPVVQVVRPLVVPLRYSYGYQPHYDSRYYGDPYARTVRYSWGTTASFGVRLGSGCHIRHKHRRGCH